MFKTNLFANNFRFSLGDEYEAKWTLMLVEPDCFNIVNESKEITRNASVVSQVNYWITIKWCFMKHFPQKIKNEFGNEVNNKNLNTLGWIIYSVHAIAKFNNSKTQGWARSLSD